MDSSVTDFPPLADAVRTAHQHIVQAGVELEKLLTPAPAIPAPTVPQEMTVAQRQARTLTAIASLVASHPDMPTVNWQVYDHVPDQAVGQVHNESDEQARDAVTAWATLLGSEVTHSRSQDDTWTQKETTASSGGVDFRIWAMVDRRSEGAASDG